LIVAADQVMQFGRPIHAGMPRPTPTRGGTAGRSGRRPSKPGTTKAPFARA
jgi:hypothetical protein